jgi:cold shock CspA family protein
MAKHKDVEFAVGDAGDHERIFKDFNEAAGFAFSIAASGRENVYLDVLIFSKAGARAWGGDEAVEQYNEDPEASVFERFEIKVNAMGRVA